MADILYRQFIRQLASMIDDEHALLRALALMCAQYIGDGDFVDHECISAGEEVVALLVKHGMIEASGRGGRWTEAGEAERETQPLGFWSATLWNIALIGLCLWGAVGSALA